MKKLKLSVLNWITLATIVACPTIAYCVEKLDKAQTETACENYLEDNKAFPGMFFSTENVVEEYEYDDAYCLLYDDADANMFEVEICVDLETFTMVQNATKSGKHIVGTLVLNDDYSHDGLEVFAYMSEPEFEMAEASARACEIEVYQLNF